MVFMTPKLAFSSALATASLLHPATASSSSTALPKYEREDFVEVQCALNMSPVHGDDAMSASDGSSLNSVFIPRIDITNKNAEKLKGMNLPYISSLNSLLGTEQFQHYNHSDPNVL